MKSKASYVITKPIQYITARNLAEQLGQDSPNLYIVPNFSCANDFFSNVRRFDKVWGRVVYVPNRWLLPFYRLINCNILGKLFTDSDIYKDSLINFLSSPASKVSVYEEGFYSYVSDQNLHMSRNGKSFRLRVYNLFKLPKGLGLSGWTDKLFLYKPCASNLNKTLKIEKSIIMYLKENMDFFSIIFNVPEISLKEKKTISIYCTGPDEIKINTVLSSMTFDVIKPHPAVNIADLTVYTDVLWESSLTPIEMVVILFAANNNKIIFVHENSTSVLYLSALDLKEIEFINVGSYVTGYDDKFLEVLSHFKGEL